MELEHIPKNFIVCRLVKGEPMSKLIYVDKLKKDILALRDCYNGFSDTYDKACIIGVIDEQPTIEERKWIPWNSEKLPEESGTYTVTAYDGATNRVTYAKYQKRLKRWELTGARAYWRVLAWQPLPEAYKGE